MALTNSIRLPPIGLFQYISGFSLDTTVCLAHPLITKNIPVVNAAKRIYRLAIKSNRRLRTLFLSSKVCKSSHLIRLVKLLPEVPGYLKNYLLPPKAVSILTIISIFQAVRKTAGPNSISQLDGHSDLRIELIPQVSGNVSV